MTEAQRKELAYIRAGGGVTYFLSHNSPSKIAMLRRMAAKGLITFVEVTPSVADCYITSDGESALTPAPSGEDGDERRRRNQMR